MKKYYISDLHFGDRRIFEKCLRGRFFKDLDDYTDKIIIGWNRLILPCDEVYILGDIAGDYYIPAIEILKRLHGMKYLAVGNHDLPMLEEYKKSKLFISVEDNLFIEDNGRKIHCSHYPLMDWRDCDYGSYLIYGHIHNKNLPQVKEYYNGKSAFNAGCDVLGYIPRTLDEMIALKEKNKNEPFVN